MDLESDCLSSSSFSLPAQLISQNYCFVKVSFFQDNIQDSPFYGVDKSSDTDVVKELQRNLNYESS